VGLHLNQRGRRVAKIELMKLGEKIVPEGEAPAPQ
jgi:hypothetical protein